MPMNEGESLEDFDARLKREANPVKSVSEMSETERRAALEVLTKPAPYVSPLPADLAGKSVSEMTEAERRKSASLLGIQNYV